jgi:hypothetical protein
MEVPSNIMSNIIVNSLHFTGKCNCHAILTFTSRLLFCEIMKMLLYPIWYLLLKKKHLNGLFIFSPRKTIYSFILSEKSLRRSSHSHINSILFRLENNKSHFSHITFRIRCFCTRFTRSHKT